MFTESENLSDFTFLWHFSLFGTRSILLYFLRYGTFSLTSFLISFSLGYKIKILYIYELKN